MDIRPPLESELRIKAQQDEIYRQFGVANLEVPSQPTSKNPEQFTTNTLNTYNFTTENLAGFVPDLGLVGKKVLAITGSGDFPINAYAQGAKSVVAVDVMPTACLYSELKFAGLKRFTLPQFLDFFATNSDETFGPNSFSYNMYAQIRGGLSETARRFFDKLITPEGNNPFLAPGKMLIDKVGDMHHLRDMAYYLQDEEKYKQAQERVKPTLFYPQPINQFLASSAVKSNSFDLIYLSNVPGTYLDRGVKNHMELKERPELARLVKKALAPNGRWIFTGFREKTEVEPWKDAYERGAHPGFVLGTTEQLVPQPTLLLPSGFNDHYLLVDSLVKTPKLVDRVIASFRRS